MSYCNEQQRHYYNFENGINTKNQRWFIFNETQI